MRQCSHRLGVGNGLLFLKLVQQTRERGLEGRQHPREDTVVPVGIQFAQARQGGFVQGDWGHGGGNAD